MHTRQNDYERSSHNHAPTTKTKATTQVCNQANQSTIYTMYSHHRRVFFSKFLNFWIFFQSKRRTTRRKMKSKVKSYTWQAQYYPSRHCFSQSEKENKYIYDAKEESTCSKLHDLLMQGLNVQWFLKMRLNGLLILFESLNHTTNHTTKSNPPTPQSNQQSPKKYPQMIIRQPMSRLSRSTIFP